MCDSNILSNCFSFGYSTKLYKLNHTECSNFCLGPVTYHNAAAALIVIFVCSLFFWFVFSKFLGCLNLCFDIISYFWIIICCYWFRYFFLTFIILFAFWKSNYVYVDSMIFYHSSWKLCYVFSYSFIFQSGQSILVYL